MKDVMVTRTVLSTTVEVLCLNTETAEPLNLGFTLAGDYTEQPEKKVLAQIEKTANYAEIIRPVHVVGMSLNEKRYGMKLSTFMANSEELEPLKKGEIEE